MLIYDSSLSNGNHDVSKSLQDRDSDRIQSLFSKGYWLLLEDPIPRTTSLKQGFSALQLKSVGMQIETINT